MTVHQLLSFLRLLSASQLVQHSLQCPHFCTVVFYDSCQKLFSLSCKDDNQIFQKLLTENFLFARP